MSQSPPDLVLRAARPADAEAITDMLNLPGFRWGTLRVPFQAPERTRKWLENDSANEVRIVAVIDGTVIGNADITRFAGRRAHAGALGMGVHDAWTGRGVGRALLGALLETADNWWGLRRVELSVFADNVAALALYRRFGFEVEGTYRGYALREGVLVDAHAMARWR